MRRASLLAAAVLAAALTACAGDDQRRQGRTRVETTRVDVVEGIGRRGGFDAQVIYKRLSPGVVTVISLFRGRPLLGDDDGEGGQGSGFVLDGSGYIATNAHVVLGPDERRAAKEVYVEFANGDRARARVVGADPHADVALIRVNPPGLTLTPLRLGSSARLRVGEPVAAIGSPFGEPQSLTVGVVSALDRNIESLTRFQIGNAIQTDAAINPGNSGGPLLDGHGRVVGINAQIKSRSGGGEGVGFAIPVDVARRSLREIRAKGHVDYGYLGVSTAALWPELADRIGVAARAGALVEEVQSGSPADRAGIKAGDKEIDFQGERHIKIGGDVIVAVDGKRLTRRDDLADVISAKSAGEVVALEVLRGHDRRTVSVKLGRRPLEPGG